MVIPTGARELCVGVWAAPMTRMGWSAQMSLVGLWALKMPKIPRKGRATIKSLL